MCLACGQYPSEVKLSIEKNNGANMKINLPPSRDTGLVQQEQQIQSQRKLAKPGVSQIQDHEGAMLVIRSLNDVDC